MVRRVSIFGVTGSIGQSACKVLAQHDDVCVDVITGHNNVQLMAQCITQLNPQTVVMADQAAVEQLRALCPSYEGDIHYGRKALCAAAQRPVDVSLQAVLGFEGVALSLLAAQHSKRIALANKEALVCAGGLLRKICQTYDTQLIPVDSEHSALFQCLGAHPMSAVRMMTLTASGGPFRTTPIEKMRAASVEQALQHPTWSMGARITIDSATMFNKAMELIEAQQLFDLLPQQLNVVVHPESIIHGMVEFADYSTLAQLSPPDMAGPIAYALNYPDRCPTQLAPLNLAKLGQLTFEAVDHDRFPAIAMAMDVITHGGLAGTCFNAAKEVALDRFLRKDIGFFDMNYVVSGTMDALSSHSDAPADDLDAIQAMNDLARQTALKINVKIAVNV